MSFDLAADPGRQATAAQDNPWGVIASTVAHALLLAAIATLALTRPIVAPPPPRSVEVELISPADLLPPAATPDAQVMAAPAIEPDEPAEAAPPPTDGPIAATEFYASRILSQDGQIAGKMRTLGTDERVIQLCNIEALEQIKAARPEFAPDTLVAYAFGDMNVAAGVLTAPGGAFRSRRKWWNVNLKCAVTPDYSAVTAFEFTLGDEIPEDQWDEHFLTAEDEEE
jgi:hypothetical protein